MAREIGIGDEVAVKATVGHRIDERWVSIRISGYNQPHSIADATAKRGQEIELTGEVTRVDEDSVTIALGPLVTLPIDKVRLVAKYKPPTRKRPLVDKPS